MRSQTNLPSAVEGAAAVMTMLAMIGAEGVTDAKVMRIFTEKEVPIRDLVKYVLEQIASEQ